MNTFCRLIFLYSLLFFVMDQNGMCADGENTLQADSSPELTSVLRAGILPLETKIPQRSLLKYPDASLHPRGGLFKAGTSYHLLHNPVHFRSIRTSYLDIIPKLLLRHFLPSRQHADSAPPLLP
jgi:hypothetical protein